MGPFKFSIPDHARKIEIANIPQIKRDILTKEVSFDPTKHDIYLFKISAIILQNPKGSKKVLKKREYSRVDRIFVLVKSSEPEIEFLNIYPVSRSGTKKHEQLTYPLIPFYGKLKPQGRVKEILREGDRQIIAGWDSDYAQWVFCKPYIENRTDFGMKILCVVPKDLVEKDRSILCYVSAKEQGREILGVRGKRIKFPLN